MIPSQVATGHRKHMHIVGPIIKIQSDPRFAWIPACVCDEAPNEELISMLTKAGFVFRPYEFSVSRLSGHLKHQTGVFLPSGWTYNLHNKGHLLDDKGEIIATTLAHSELIFNTEKIMKYTE